jgi:hypothetical protein
MLAIGEVMDVQDVPLTPDLDLVTNGLESAIVREYTYEELLLSRQARPEALGPFADLSTEELHRELDRYESFLVEVRDGDYRLVIGFSGAESHPHTGARVLYAAPTGCHGSVAGAFQRRE